VSTIPIIFVSGGDPVGTGLVSSLSRPGGNLTGVTNFTGDLNGKRFGLFREIVRQAAIVGVLSDSTNPNGSRQPRAASGYQFGSRTSARKETSKPLLRPSPGKGCGGIVTLLGLSAGICGRECP
jgi:ABC transporter substrate binding protein